MSSMANALQNGVDHPIAIDRIVEVISDRPPLTQTHSPTVRPAGSDCVVAVVLLIVVVVMPSSPKSLWFQLPPCFSNSERLMMRHQLEEARSTQRRALTELITKALSKTPKQSQEQSNCTHKPLRLRANQYGVQRSCPTCGVGLKMVYMQTVLAVEAAIARQSRPRRTRRRAMTRAKARSLLQEEGRQREESLLSPGSPKFPKLPLKIVFWVS